MIYLTQNIVECLREESIKNLFKTKGFNNSFSTWKAKINGLTTSKTPRQILDIGDNLFEIFTTTRTSGRSQSQVSAGGSSWESLVCWYLNLCLVGRRTVVIKHSKKLIPFPISDAITVNYSNFISNTESDLIAITFPEKEEYIADKETISIRDENGIIVPPVIGKRFNLLPILNALSNRDFNDIEIHIIQCKTNWNDNAQIPMLWDMIYSANNFRNNITIGRNGFSIHNSKRFTYSFVTVPTSRVNNIKYSSTCVKRVSNISGGNYWGRDTVNGVASSVKEMLQRNLSTGHSDSHLTTLGAEIVKLNSEYAYFRL